MNIQKEPPKCCDKLTELKATIDKEPYTVIFQCRECYKLIYRS